MCFETFTAAPHRKPGSYSREFERRFFNAITFYYHRMDALPPPLTSTLPPVQGYCAAAYRFKPSSKDGNTCFVPSSLSGFDEPLIRFDDLSVSLSVRIC